MNISSFASLPRHVFCGLERIRIEIVSNFNADAALTLRKKRGFSVCSVAGSRSRDYQSNPHFQCGIALLTLLLCLLAAGCDVQKLLKEDRHELYPPHALADPFTCNMGSGTTSWPRDPRWYKFYSIVNRPDEDDDDYFISAFELTSPPIRSEVDLIPYPSGHTPSEEEIRKAKEEARAYWHAQGLKLWGSEAVIYLRKASYGAENYCFFDPGYDSLKYNDREALLARAMELGNADAAYLYTQAMINSYLFPSRYKEYNSKYEGGLWGRLEYAASLGSPEAVLHMARCFYFGNMTGVSAMFVGSGKKEIEVPINIEKSIHMAEQSLEMGCVDALPFLVMSYADPTSACFSLKKAHAYWVAHEGLKQHYRISNAYFSDRSYSNAMLREGYQPVDRNVRPGALVSYADKLTPEELHAAEEEGKKLLEKHSKAIEEKQRLRLEHYARWRAELLRDIDQSMPWLRFMLLPEEMANDLRNRMYVWAVEKGLAEKIGPSKEDSKLKRALTWDDYMAMDHEYRMKKWSDISILVRWCYPKPGEWKPERRMWDNWSWEKQKKFWELVDTPMREQDKQ